MTQELPPIAPARYCFASCRLDAFIGARSTEEAVALCPGGPRPPTALVEATTPRQVTHAALMVNLVASSTATLTVHTDLGSFSDTTHLEGEIAIHAPGCRAPEQSCSNAAITSLNLRGLDDLNFPETTITGIEAANLTALPGAIYGTTATESTLMLFPGGQVLGQALRNGQRDAGSLGLSDPLIATIDWSARTFTLDGTLSGGDVSLTLQIDGALANLPPVADAGPDATFECGVDDVVLSGAGSTDPDGIADIVAYTWTRATPTGNAVIASTRDMEVNLPVGTHDLALTVRDSRGQLDVDAVELVIQDTLSPTIEVEALSDCLWPPNHEMALFRLGTELDVGATDACGVERAVRIVDVRSSEPACDGDPACTEVDVRFGTGAVCLRAERDSRVGRAYTIVLEVADPTGNTTRREVVIRVPHDQRPSDRCTTHRLIPRVDDDDPRCSFDLPEPLPAPSVVPTPPRASTARPEAPSEVATCSARRGDGAPPVVLLFVAVVVGFAARHRRRQ